MQVPASEPQAAGADDVRADDVLFAFGVIADVQYAYRFSAFAPARSATRRSLCVARSLALRKRERARERAQVHGLDKNVNGGHAALSQLLLAKLRTKLLNLREDGQNFQKTVTRRYRNALAITKEAVADWCFIHVHTFMHLSIYLSIYQSINQSMYL